MAYRDDVTALSARYDALAAEVAQKTRELEGSRRLLEQARAGASLPVLDNLRVATPCTADWNRMAGDERVRRCGDCRKTVYNLSGMTRDEAEALVIERNGELCVRYYQRHDGTIVLADCTIGVSRGNRHKWIAAGAASLVAAGLGAAAVLHQLPAPERVETTHVHAIMGAPGWEQHPLTQPHPASKPPLRMTGRFTMGLVAPPTTELPSPPAAEPVTRPGSHPPRSSR